MTTRLNDLVVKFTTTLGQLLPGVAASIAVAGAAAALSTHYNAPVMLFALLLGMAMHFLVGKNAFKPGVEFVACHVLRVGVALLGLRITMGQITELGWQPLALVGITVVVTICLSMAIARAVGFQTLFGLLTGGATAICGASAALALAAALPNHPGKERATLFTVIGVSVLSTIAMIVYPMIAHAIQLSPQASGIFLGATIHDVAQVVGAGYGISRETGDTATVVKLLRIAMLLPVIVCAALITRARNKAENKDAEPGTRPPILPWFAVVFVVLVAINSFGWTTSSVQSWGNDLSRWCLVSAIAAIGIKTNLERLAEVGIKPVALMIGETVFLAAFVLALLHWGL
jgi:uncharacterized integral membrane protein (TIGR00698 family)